MDKMFECFAEVVRNVLGKKMSADKIEEIFDKIPKKCCKDQYVGCVSKILSESPNMDFPDRKELEEFEKCKEKLFPYGVVIVLESPNKAEFRKVGSEYESRGPARHCTGCHFREYWSLISAGKFGEEWKDYAIFLINAVQYQCSLAHAGRDVPKGAKDVVFCKCMEQQKIVDSLRSRIDDVRNLCDDLILVNACTRGCNGEGYKAVSKILLACNDGGSRVFGTTHPCGWQCHRNRVFQELSDSMLLPPISKCSF